MSVSLCRFPGKLRLRECLLSLKRLVSLVLKSPQCLEWHSPPVQPADRIFPHEQQLAETKGLS